MTNSLNLLNGKYTFTITDQLQVTIRRYGEPWREFEIGDKAMYSLVAHAIDLEAENKRMRTALEYIKINTDVECNCYVEEAVNYIEPCIYCVAKNALEEK